MKFKTKPPKQLKHWLKLLGYKPETKHNKLYFKGKHRRLRLILEDQFWGVQLSEPHKDFDRWANSTQYTILGIDGMVEFEFLDEVIRVTELLDSKG